jgi:hypothetical protein
MKSLQLMVKYFVFIKFETLAAVKMSMFVFWVVTPCGLVGTALHTVYSYKALQLKTSVGLNNSHHTGCIFS